MYANRGTTLPTAEAPRAAVATFATTAAGTAVDTCGTGATGWPTKSHSIPCVVM